VTGANVTAEHESSCAIGPTFENVRTTRFLADGVQIETFDQLQHVVLIRRIAQTDAKPFRLGLADLLVIADYTEFAGQWITSKGILRGKGFLAQRRKDAKEDSASPLRLCAFAWETLRV
jgi:hypothetical protein